jgi:mono/diheme cytochrome c family protein
MDGIKAIVSNTLKIAAICIVAILGACNYSLKKTSPDATDFAGKTSGSLTFALVMENVIAPRCLECHSNARGNKGDVNLETYSQVRLNILDVKSDVEDGSMPKKRAPLSAEQKALILNWISQGYPEFAATTGTPPPTTAEPDPTLPAPTDPTEPEVLDFRTVFRRVIQPACLKCHSAPDNEGDVNLETYANVFKNRKEIESDVRDGSMPKKKKLTPEQRDLLLRWLQAGAAEEARPSEPLPPEVREYDPTDTSTGAPPRSPEALKVLKRGQYLYRAGLCANCHTVDARKPLAGGLKIQSPFGTFYTPNITPDRKTGIGNWSADDFIRSMRNGLSPRFQIYYPAFPYTNYSKLSDADMLDLRAYLMALKPIHQKNRAHILKFPYNQRALLGPWRLLNFPYVFNANEFNFQLAQGAFEPIVGKSPEWNRGAYLTEGAFHCTQCHTPRGSLGSLKMDEWMSGSSLSGEKRAASNLTPDRRTGLGSWSESDWIHFLKTATTPAGSNVGGEMRKIVLNSTALLTPEDQRAIAIYMRSLRPVRNDQIKTIDSK